MKSFVIAIEGHQQSQEAADRCIASGKRFGVDIKKFPAITPNNNLDAIAKRLGIDTAGFEEMYSRQENCTAAFMSHMTLWQSCVDSNVPHVIFEHDAVLVDFLPLNFPKYVGSIGAPSYGKAMLPRIMGWNGLVSKRYFPGAHAYMITPEGAKKLIEQAQKEALPTDVFLHIETFPWLQEYYPWPAEARDTFTTIQNKRGCTAKHNYKDGYEISEV